MTNVPGPPRAADGRRQQAQAVALLGAAVRRHRHGRVDPLLRRPGPVRPHHRRRPDPGPGGGGKPLPRGVRAISLLRAARPAAIGRGAGAGETASRSRLPARAEKESAGPSASSRACSASSFCMASAASQRAASCKASRLPEFALLHVSGGAALVASRFTPSEPPGLPRLNAFSSSPPAFSRAASRYPTICRSG